VLAADADAYRAALELLSERGAGQVAHSGGTLLEHLRRVYCRLVEYEAGRTVRLAGLCHAAYGTDGFAQRLLADEEAPLLITIIGSEAEGLVRLYADCDRALVYAGLDEDPVVYVARSTGARHVLSAPLTRRLVELIAADEMDVAEASPEFRRQQSDRLLMMFTGARRWLGDAAWRDFLAIFGPDTTYPLRKFPMSVTGLDHLVLTVADIEASVAFYCGALGMSEVSFGSGRRAVAFGGQKINLHPGAAPVVPHARRPTPGSADLCLLTEVPIDHVGQHLQAAGVRVEHGPVRRTGAVSPLLSIYVRDPDGNLVEISNALSTAQPAIPAAEHARKGW
jgi:catechol 2,3-dioxygenase-like lactoylglutathione lyase family enzyme